MANDLHSVLIDFIKKKGRFYPHNQKNSHFSLTLNHCCFAKWFRGMISILIKVISITYTTQSHRSSNDKWTAMLKTADRMTETLWTNLMTAAQRNSSDDFKIIIKSVHDSKGRSNDKSTPQLQLQFVQKRHSPMTVGIVWRS